MVKLRNSFFRKLNQHKHRQYDEMLSTFMKITRVINKLKNKIINCSSFQVSPTVNKLLYELKCPAISFDLHENHKSKK